MYKRTVILTNNKGLDEQLAIDFINSAAGFESKIRIKAIDEEKTANAKSIIMLVGLELKKGQELELNAIGEDEIEAIDTLVGIIEHNGVLVATER